MSVFIVCWPRPSSVSIWSPYWHELCPRAAVTHARDGITVCRRHRAGEGKGIGRSHQKRQQRQKDQSTDRDSNVPTERPKYCFGRRHQYIDTFYTKVPIATSRFWQRGQGADRDTKLPKKTPKYWQRQECADRDSTVSIDSARCRQRRRVPTDGDNSSLYWR